MQDTKRIRSPNFTIEEKLLLLNILKKYKHLIENKKTDGRTWKEKDLAWEDITKEFNSRNSNLVIRTKENLKKYYENKKKEVRKQAAVERTDRFKTGGGPPISCINDPTYELTMDIMNKKTVVGLENKYDDDNDDSDDHVLLEEDMEYEILTVQVDKDVNGSNDDHKETQNVEQHKKNNVHPVRKQYASQRRPTICSSENLMHKYEDLANIKMEMVNLQCSILKTKLLEQKEEMKHYEKERQFQEEEWQLKKEALMLDIAIKNAQLNALRNVM